MNYKHVDKIFRHKKHDQDRDFRDFKGVIFLKKEKQTSTVQTETWIKQTN